jgi:2'-5' RNA ligase
MIGQPDGHGIDRAFIAIPLDQEWRDYCGKIIESLSSHKNSFRWISPGDMHFTVKFLGPVPQERQSVLDSKILGVVSKMGPLELRAGKLGGFPRLKAPRVIWLSIGENDGLRQLYKEVDSACCAAGFTTEDREYKPHLTLARLKGKRPSSIDADSLKSLVAPPLLSVGKLELMRSVLDKDGAHYTSLKTYELAR